ncbi:hypothetical protein MLD38_000862 [Melastoma candidum]|uniref:Uncharacterized protein n=1 Tax=Melastoma candidum TaxID=119954 RepID=A0ACB9SBA7_9MYRT|nr:hypothetical protein MLD38_000862 [Melastoma candidum]
MGACCSKSDVQGGKFVGVSGNGDAAVLDSAGAAVGVRQNSFSLAASSGRWMKFGSLRKRNSSGYYEDNDLPINRQVNVAGKMCMNGASNVACLYTQQGKKGTNQDAMVVWEVGCSVLPHVMNMTTQPYPSSLFGSIGCRMVGAQSFRLFCLETEGVCLADEALPIA